MHEIERTVLVALPPILGIDMSVTNEVVLLWVSAVLTFAAVFFACRRTALVPLGAYQNIFEGLVQYIDEQVVGEAIGPEGRRWSPVLLTLFFFILVSNLLGMTPAPDHVKAVTSDISVTLGLALFVFGLTIYVNLRHHGVIGFLKKFFPSGLPGWVAVIVVPVEIVSWIAKPLSLAIRLFANMMAGHALILIFIAMEVAVVWFLVPLPMAGAVVMSGFEIFVSLIQAFIFTMLSAMYLKDAIEAH